MERRTGRKVEGKGKASPDMSLRVVTETEVPHVMVSSGIILNRKHLADSFNLVLGVDD